MNDTTSDIYTVRSLRADEWPAVKELRLAALQDPVAPIAFLETYDNAVSQPDSFWEERAARAAEGATSGVQQFVAERADGTWVGSVTVLLEEAGTSDWAGFPVERRQGHLVGVFVRPEARGSGVAKELFDASVEWAWGQGAERIRLIVHQDNPRAQGFYRKVGFVPSGVVVPLPQAPGEAELEFVLERS
ncbi:GNAT family N-acetyltransferase [Streptomyces graminofaciens]|uniref:GNAT family N-acetyltransferase n=1 Tax=Streptomyces graminofaciens TaxID=68212 RepID=UPI00257252AE|nr:GNAT family N-acetyltransferase [Streptomyces graminofaciens]